MTDTNMIESVRSEIVLLGKELEFASGIRAVAAEQVIEGGVSDPDEMYSALEKIIVTDQLFESYRDPMNSQNLGFFLGEGVPFTSLDAYIGLHDHYGSEWLLLAMTDYCAHFGCVELRSDPEQFAKDYLERARDNFACADKPEEQDAGAPRFVQLTSEALAFMVSGYVGPAKEARVKSLKQQVRSMEFVLEFTRRELEALEAA